ncbi:MAG: transcription termination/antitermination protein NusG [Planctomycetaceae bacterium]|nr:transcription termination/antitermination protein NusG [Planctomycetaceae bacterium]
MAIAGVSVVNVVPESSHQPAAPLADQAQDARLAGAENPASVNPVPVNPVPAPPADITPPAAAEPVGPPPPVESTQPPQPADDTNRFDPIADAADADDAIQEDAVQEDEGSAFAQPLEFIDENIADEDLKFEWFILKVQVNREDSIKDALLRRVKMNGLDRYFKDIVVPTEDVAEFTKTGKRRVVKKKLYPGYILVNMAVNDDSWFLVRETPGIGDFTGSAGKPTPMEPKDVERILRSSKLLEDVVDPNVKTAIPFKKGDRVRVKEGYFQNFEGDVESIDQAHGRVTVMITIFGRPTPVEIEHWQIELI